MAEFGPNDADPAKAVFEGYPRSPARAPASVLRPIRLSIGRWAAVISLAVVGAILALLGLAWAAGCVLDVFAGEFDHGGWALVGMALGFLSAAALAAWAALRVARWQPTR